MNNPNASILCCFTVPEEEELRILALIKFPINDYWDSKPYQFRFEQGKKFDVPAKKNIDLDFRQWIILSSDSEINSWMDELINSGHSSFGTPFIFEASIDEEIDSADDFQERDWPGPNTGIPRLFKLNNPEKEYSFTRNPILLSNIERDIIPPGLFAKGKLYDLIFHMVLIDRNVIDGFDLHGIRIEDEEPEEGKLKPVLKGFVQATEENREDLILEIAEEEGPWSPPVEVNPKTGVWTYNSDKPVSVGKYRIKKAGGTDIIFENEFRLIKSINVNFEMVEIHTKDLWNRRVSKKTSSEKITAGHDEGKRIDESNNLVTSLNWNRDNYKNDNISELELSDMIYPIFESLAPRILISDPYLFGEIVKDGDEYVLNKGQKIFFNAIIWTCSNIEIDELCLLGRKSEIKDVLFNDYIEIFKKLKMFGPKKVTIKLSDSKFHSRHWIGLKGSSLEDVIILADHSIGGLAASHDFSVRLLEGSNAISTASRLREEWETAILQTEELLGS